MHKVIKMYQKLTISKNKAKINKSDERSPIIKQEDINKGLRECKW